jgi:hypothetical protein
MATPKKKILVNIWTSLLFEFEKRTEQACFKRDAFLNRILKTEIPLLDREVPEPNSDKAYRYIAKQLATLPRTAVGLSLDPDVVEQMDGVCDLKNIPRDAFLNRLLFFLTFGYKALEAISGRIDLHDSVVEIHDEGLDHDGSGTRSLWQPFETIEDVLQQPFWFIRNSLGIGKPGRG